MGLLTMFGLMKVEDHKAETHRLNLDLAKQGNALSEAKAEARKAAGEVERLTRGWEKANADISLLRRQLNVSEAELAKIRPYAEKFRAKAARDAEVKRAKRAAAKKATGKG